MLIARWLLTYLVTPTPYRTTYRLAIVQNFTDRRQTDDTSYGSYHKRDR